MMIPLAYNGFFWFVFRCFIGGMTGAAGGATSVDSVEIFSLATRTWNRVASLPETR